MNGEVYSYLFEKLFDYGALDVYVSSILMKKNRPGNKLSVLCNIENEDEIKNFIFTQTSTFGIRKYSVERDEISRTFFKIKTNYGEVSVKAGYMNEKLIKVAPEYEDCKKLADLHNIPLQSVYNEAVGTALISLHNK